MRRMTAVLGLLALLASSAACVSSLSGRAYGRSDARLPMTVQRGVVDSVRLVKIEGTRSGLGGLAGAVAGATVGSGVGGGAGQAMATVAGAILGGLAGSAIEQDATTRQGLEIVVRLDSGPLYAIVQEQAQGEAFTPGEEVEVLTAQDGSMRVRPRPGR
ncbi:MAG: glycine zipper 2TM domain-containing protein [Acidobacteriota bacterium]